MAVELDSLIECFARGSVPEKYDALRQLIAQRKHHTAVKDKRFQTGIDSLLQIVGDPLAADLDRLLSVAILGRLASTVKRLREVIYKSLHSPLEKILPEPSLLSEPDDRSYIGYACERIQPEWGVIYCARAAIYEETGEQSRVAFLKALMSMKPDLASLLQLLSEIVHEFIPVTEDPGTSTARRLKRLMAALRIALSETLIEPGEEPGKQLAQVCRAAFKDVPAPKQEGSLFEAAEGLGAVVHEMVRLRFSLATESSTYSALKVIKSKVPGYVWERFAVASQSLEQVAQDISEALLILAKQGITDDSLAGELAIAAGHEKYGRQMMKKLAKIAGLSANARNWLAEGENQDPVNTQTPQGETRQLNDDSQLADLLVDSLRFQVLGSAGCQQILPEIEMLDPRLGEEVKRLLQRGVALCDTIQTIARRKGLRVRGNPGDEEEYAPLEHEVIGDNRGIRRVRIIRPVVEQVRDNGVAFVISKGVVERI